MLKNVFLAFIPIFVAVDAIGVLPIFISLTEGISKKEKHKIIYQSIITALGLAIGFIFSSLKFYLEVVLFFGTSRESYGKIETAWRRY